MIKVTPVLIEGYTFVATEVQLPKTTLLVVQCDTGYVMCGALDVELLRTKLMNRGIVAARAVGVKTMNELLQGQVESCTQAAEALGIEPGQSIMDALVKMARVSDHSS